MLILGELFFLPCRNITDIFAATKNFVSQLDVVMTCELLSFSLMASMAI
jgi:hypothetical protein